MIYIGASKVPKGSKKHISKLIYTIHMIYKKLQQNAQKNGSCATYKNNPPDIRAVFPIGLHTTKSVQG